MTKKELKELMRSVIADELDSLKEDITNMMSVLLAEMQQNKNGKSIIDEGKIYTNGYSQSTGGAHSMVNYSTNRLDAIFKKDATRQTKVGMDSPRQSYIPPNLQDMLKETLDDGDWVNIGQDY